MNSSNNNKNGVSRRDFLVQSLVTAAGLAAGARLAGASPAKASMSASAPAIGGNGAKPNILFITLDQISCDSIHAYGCKGVNTPNLDFLIQNGTSFTQSYSANPVCCPARASWFTGHYSPETGIMNNSYVMAKDWPDIGQWMKPRGYNVVYTGKWHVPGRPVQNSFRVLSSDPKNTASTGDIVTTRSVEGFLQNYSDSKPFFLSAGLLNPHDICSFSLTNSFYKGHMPYEQLADQLPDLPGNFHVNMTEPKEIVARRKKYANGGEGQAGWKDNYWQYYLWAYHRYIEMVDGQVGMILSALENSKFANNTLVILSGDHGDGHTCHQLTLKSFLYDEAARVPFILYWPGHVRAGVIDNDHLVSGVDVVPTV